MRIVAATGPDALTHRRVAEEAGVPLAATTYWFASKDELIAEAYALAAARDVARIEEVAAELAHGEFPTGAGLAAGLSEVPTGADPSARLAEFPTGADLAARLAELAAGELHAERAGLIAGYALCLEAARRPALRATSQAWTDAYVALATTMMTAAGSARPELDARLLVAALDGMLLEQLARDAPDFERAVLRPALERLIAALLALGRPT